LALQGATVTRAGTLKSTGRPFHKPCALRLAYNLPAIGSRYAAFVRWDPQIIGGSLK